MHVGGHEVVHAHPYIVTDAAYGDVDQTQRRLQEVELGYDTELVGELAP